MFKIAFSGMKGRKKDTFLMGFVIVLSFIFVITSITLYTSSEATKHQDKIEKYGTWRTVLKKSFNPLDKSSIADEYIYNVDILGSSQVGKVGVLSNGFQNLAHFQLIEGHLPTAMDEVAIEYSKISQFPKGIKIGDTIPLRISFIIEQKSEERAIEESISNYYDEHIDEVYQFAMANPKHEINNILLDYMSFFRKNKIQDYLDVTGELNLDIIDPIYESNLKSELIQESLMYELYDIYCVTQEYNRFNSKRQGNVIIDELETLKYTFFSPNRSDFKLNQSKQGAKFNSSLTDQEMFDRGSVEKREVVITVPAKVTGFIQDYANTWCGDVEYPNAYVVPVMGEKIYDAFYSANTFNVSEYKHDQLLFSTLNEKAFSDDFDENTIVYSNEYMYSSENTQKDKTYTMGILGLTAIVTVSAVFQINLTQMKRRTRKIVLLKSVGAIKSQIRSLLFFEVIIYFLFSIPLGLLIGVFGSWGVIQILKSFFNIHLIFQVDATMMFWGIFLSVVTVVLGMALPFAKAFKVPLSGTMNLSLRKKHTKKYIKPKNNLITPRKLTFRHISITHVKRDRKKHTLTLALNTMIIITLLLMIVLSYNAYIPYIDQVIINNAPDFSIEMNHGLGQRDRELFLNEIRQISGVKNTELIQYGEKAFMYDEFLFNSKPYLNMPSIPSYKKYVNITEENDYLIKKARYATSYGIDVNGIAMEKLMRSGAADTLDVEKFIKGEEVILLLPAYSDSEKSLSYMKRGVYNNNYAISVGVKFNLTIPTENRTTTGFTNDVAFHELTVGAIVNSIDGEGIWAFSKNQTTPIIITTYANLANLYSKVCRTPKIEFDQTQTLIRYLEPTKNGNTHFYIYANKNANLLEMETAISKLSNKYHFKPIRHYVANEIIFNNSLKLTMIIVVLGVSIVLISFMILYNTTLSKIESERERIGTLQSLGVTQSQFKKFYTTTGFVSSILSLLGGLCLGVMSLVLLRGGLENLIISRFATIWLFPWLLFISVSIIFIVVCVLIYYLPIKKTLNIAPIHNINALQK